MRRAEGREKSSVLFLGKGIIILSLVLASSLSFVLGYFVGKNKNPGDASQMQPAPAPIPYEQPPAATGEQAPVQPEKAGVQQQPLQTQEGEPAPLKEQSENPEKPWPGSSATQKNYGTVSGSNQKQVQQKTAVTSQVKKNAEVTKEACQSGPVPAATAQEPWRQAAPAPHPASHWRQYSSK